MNFIRNNHLTKPFPIVEFFQEQGIRDEQEAKDSFKAIIAKIKELNQDRTPQSLIDFAFDIISEKYKILTTHESDMYWKKIKLENMEQKLSLEADEVALNREQFMVRRASKRMADLISYEEDRKTPTIKKEESNKKLRSYLEGRNLDDEVVEKLIKWEVDGQIVSDSLLQYRQSCIEKANSNYLSSDIDVIALNGIFYISHNNKRYGIRDSLYKKLIEQIQTKYKAQIDMDMIDEFQVNQLRKIYKLASEDSKKAMKDASDLGYDNDNEKELMSESLRNIISEQTSTTTTGLEDKFTKKFVTPLFSPFFKDTKHFKSTGCDEESKGSKERRKKHGRKSDIGYKVVHKDLEQQLLHIEIKNPAVVNEDETYHPDFVKLCNVMKDEIDSMLQKNCPLEIPVFGVLVGGHKVTAYCMDLIYTGVYRLCDVGWFYLPHSLNDLCRLDATFNVMIKLKALLLKSCEDCLSFLKKKESPGTPPIRRQLYVKSFKSPQKIK